MKFSADPFNQEFVRLLAKSGWNQSEAAKRLHLSPAAISMFVGGETRPSGTVLQLMKLMVGDEAPLPGGAGGERLNDKPVPLDAWERELIGEMRALPPEERRVFSSAIREILGLIKPGKPVSYKRAR